MFVKHICLIFTNVCPILSIKGQKYKICKELSKIVRWSDIVSGVLYRLMYKDFDTSLPRFRGSYITHLRSTFLSSGPSIYITGCNDWRTPHSPTPVDLCDRRHPGSPRCTSNVWSQPSWDLVVARLINSCKVTNNNRNLKGCKSCKILLMLFNTIHQAMRTAWRWTEVCYFDDGSTVLRVLCGSDSLAPSFIGEIKSFWENYDNFLSKTRTMCDYDIHDFTKLCNQCCVPHRFELNLIISRFFHQWLTLFLSFQFVRTIGSYLDV